MQSCPHLDCSLLRPDLNGDVKGGGEGSPRMRQRMSEVRRMGGGVLGKGNGVVRGCWGSWAIVHTMGFTPS